MSIPTDYSDQSTQSIESKPLSRKQQSEIRHQRILDAARKCFTISGYRATSIGDIAREASVSNGLLYSFYSGKQELFEMVMHTLIEEWQQYSKDQLATCSGRPADTLKIMFRSTFEFATRHPLLMALPQQDYEFLLIDGIDAIKKANASWQQLIDETIRKGIESGEFRADLDIDNTVDIINSLQMFYVSRLFRKDRSIIPLSPDLIETMTSFIINGLTNQGTDLDP